MNGILLDMIHKKATIDYKGPEIKATNYEVWVRHWFDCAEALAVDFEKQGLPITASAVRHIIEDQRRYCKATYG